MEITLPIKFEEILNKHIDKSDNPIYYNNLAQ
jgi:hypothetical protein